MEVKSMARRRFITAAMWERLSDLLPEEKSSPKGGRPWRANQEVLEGKDPTKAPKSNKSTILIIVIMIIASAITALAGIIKAKKIHKSDDTLNSSDVSEDQLTKLKNEVENISATKNEDF